MRHIRTAEPKDKDWVRLAETLLSDLVSASNREAREKIIDDNARMWGALKDWLLELSHGKCWFSEALDCFSHWDVEHYRPKKSAMDQDGTSYDAYWWLAFDWTNLRICGNVGNRKKGTYFPLRSGSTRARYGEDLRYEDPLLLDPATASDAALISFNMDGDVVCAPGGSAWAQERVTYTEQRCKLDFPPLVNKRRVVWSDCWTRIQQYRSDLERCSNDPTNDVARATLRQAAEDIISMVRSDAELSGVARACILNSGDERVVALLRAS